MTNEARTPRLMMDAITAWHNGVFLEQFGYDASYINLYRKGYIAGMTAPDMIDRWEIVANGLYRCVNWYGKECLEAQSDGWNDARIDTAALNISFG